MPSLRINLANGQTRTFDLDNPADADAWEAFRADLRSDIRGAILQTGSGQTSVPVPKGFRSVYYSAREIPDRGGEVVADEITVQADEIRIAVVVYRRSAMVRVDVSRPGRPRMLTS